VESANEKNLNKLDHANQVKVDGEKDSDDEENQNKGEQEKGCEFQCNRAEY
jgi:hypothetical protein